jgi:hypothetical protein
MKRAPVQSTAIRSVGYDAQNHVLEIEFINGRTYQYLNVPEFLYRGLTLAKSKGEYFNRRISDRFHSEEMH